MDIPQISVQNLVIGDTLEATEFAIRRSYALVGVYQRYRYIFLDKTKKGNLKQEIWKRNKFFLSLAGLLPGAHNIIAIQITPQNKVVSLYSDTGLALQIAYEKVYIFEEAGLTGIQILKSVEPKYRVLDCYKINLRLKFREALDSLSCEPFEQIYIYDCEENSSHNSNIISTLTGLTQQQLESDDYSDVTVRFFMHRAITKKLTDKGFKVPLKNSISHLYRVAVRTNRDTYQEYDDIIYDKRTYEQICKQEQIEPFHYVRRVELYLCRKSMMDQRKDYSNIPIWQELYHLSCRKLMSEMGRIRCYYQSLVDSQSPKEP
jgi:hypothetical protein